MAIVALGFALGLDLADALDFAAAGLLNAAAVLGLGVALGLALLLLLAFGFGVATTWPSDSDSGSTTDMSRVPASLSHASMCSRLPSSLMGASYSSGAWAAELPTSIGTAGASEDSTACGC